VTIFKIIAHCPDIKAQVDIQQIREVLNDSPGFSQVEFNFLEQKVVIFTANQDGGRDIIHKLSHSGFPAQEYEVEALPANASERNEADTLPH
jgi:hypothetical protein